MGNTKTLLQKKHVLYNLTTKEVLDWIDEAYVNYSNVQLIKLENKKGPSYNTISFTVEYEEDGYWSGQ